MGLRLPRLRHLRYSLLDLTGSKRRRLIAWLTGVSTTLDSTGTGQAFTTDFATDNELAIATHGHVDGDGPFEASSTTTLPAGLAADTLYWVNAVDAGNVTLHLSQNEALAGTNEVALTDDGTGTHTLTPSTTNQAVLEKVRQGNTADQLQDETDIDNIT